MVPDCVFYYALGIFGYVAALLSWWYAIGITNEYPIALIGALWWPIMLVVLTIVGAVYLMGGKTSGVRVNQASGEVSANDETQLF